MGHSLGDGVIVAALAALFFGYLHLKHRAKMRRLELVHQERLVAMEKDFPLPELPIDPPAAPRPMDTHVILILGVVLAMFGSGCMIMLASIEDMNIHKLWVTPLPLVFIGVGLLLVYWLIHARGVGLRGHE